jgi:AcrR family transcriptional regulator
MLETEISTAKQRVLDVAEQLFMERGYAMITLRDIAGELGIQQASLYYHFPEGKEQLFVEMTERVFIRHRAGMEAAAAGAEVDLAAQLKAIANWFANQPRLNLSSMMHTDMPALSAENAAKLGRCAYQNMFQPLRAVFIGAEERNEIRWINPDVLAGTFLSVMDGIQFSGSGPGVPSRAEMANDVISVLLDGLRNRITLELQRS